MKEAVVIFRSLADIGSLKRKYPFKILYLPALEIASHGFKFPKSSFDYALITSKNALKFLNSRELKSLSVREWISIGEKTKNSLPKKIKGKSKVVSNSNSKGVLRYFKKLSKGKVFFPRSAIADSNLPKDLRKMNFKVVVLKTYTTQLKTIRKPLLKILAKNAPRLFLISSPSVLKALRKSFSLKELRKMPVLWLAIGPTTEKTLKKWKLRVQKSPRPSFEGMLDRASKIISQKA